MNRNQFFMAGIIVLLLGIQLRWIESYELNEDCSRVILKRVLKQKDTPVNQSLPALFATQTPSAQYRHTVKPPKWLGWAFVSAGVVLILHALGMPKNE